MKMKKNIPDIRILIVMIALLSFNFSAIAQQKVITGKVYSSNGQDPLPGVNVFLKGNSSKGTVTDAQGTFSMEASPDDVIVLSFIGLKTKEIQIGGLTTIDAPMEDALNEMNELVVTGTR